MRAARLILPALAVAGTLACVFHGQPIVEKVLPVSTTARVRAHLVDGSVILFPKGVSSDGHQLDGVGTRYGLRLADSAAVTGVVLDSVVALESVRANIEWGPTILVSTLAGFGLAAVAGGIIVAIECANNPKCFGSCPTFYSDSAGTPVLEAEGFSFSIAPLFEARDVDRLRAQPDSLGVVRLEVRNEALETHDINHLELLEVRHPAGALAVPDPLGKPLVLQGLTPPASAVDRAGHDVLPALQAHDGAFFRTDSLTLARADAADPHDWIDFTVPVDVPQDSVALVFRLRNSLLNTVLLYDLMLGDRGLRSVDWLTRDLQGVGPAVEMGRWARQEMGLRLSVPGDTGYVEVARIPDTGPVAWKDVAVTVPAARKGILRIRATFVADNWRIDQVAVSNRWSRPATRTVALSRVVNASGAEDTTALAALAAPDGRYLETTAGQHFTAEFAAGPEPSGTARSFLLASQGYYTEWVRRGWLTRTSDTTAFAPGRPALAEALRRWRASQDSTERRFYATRVPVR